MDKEYITKRIEELKIDNDKGNLMLRSLEEEKQQVIKELFVRNGRILELEDLFKRMD